MFTRRTALVVAAATLAASGLVVAPTTAGGQAASCEQPYSPLATAEVYPAQEELPEVDAAVASTPFDHSQNPVDMDGDGTDDTMLVDPFTNDVRVTRGDGVLELAAGGSAFTAIDGLGDLDGDGRDELGVQVSDGSYVVPGTTPVGATTVAAAGIRVVDGKPIGIGDGSDRLLVSRLDGTGPVTDLLVASEVLAVGAGGDASGVPATATVPGEPVARANLGGTVDLVLTAVDAATSSEVVVLGSDVIRLTTAPEPFLSGYTGVGSVEVLDGSDGTFVTLANSNRSGARAWMWSLDRPCGPLVAPGTATSPPPPSAPPAQPVPAEAAFTG